MGKFIPPQITMLQKEVYVTYKDNIPAKVVAVKKKGRTHYLLLRWPQYQVAERWVRDSLCTEVALDKKGKPIITTTTPKKKLTWWEKLISKIQSLWKK